MIVTSSVGDRWRQLLQFLLLAGILVPAWLSGGIHEHTLVWILRYFAMLCALILLVPGLSGRLTWLFPVLGLGLLLGGVQLLEPGWTAPASLSVLQQPYERLIEISTPLREPANGVRETFGSAGGDGPVSLDVHSTRMQLSILFLYVATCYACSRLFAGPQACARLFCFLALNGAAVAVVGLIQRLGPDTKFLAVDAPSQFPFATFVNKNNAAGYLNMCLAGALGWFLYDRYRNAHLSSSSNTGVAGQLNSLNTPGSLASVTCIIVMIAGIASSLSRGAWLATGCAMLILLVIASWKQLIRGWSAGLILAAAIVMGVFAAQSEKVQARFASLESGDALTDIRLSHWQDSYRASIPFHPFGSGLGTYQYVYRTEDTLDRDIWFRHAENQYLETLMTAGIPGVVLLALAIVICLITLGSLLSRHNLTLGGQSVAAAGVFALVSQLVHGGLDFGLYIPGIGLTLAAICGALAGTLSTSENRSRLSRLAVMPRWTSLHPVWCVVLFVGCFAGSLEISNGSRSVALQREAEQLFDERKSEGLDAKLARVERLIVIRPRDAKLRLAAARLAVLRYRIRNRDLLVAKYPEADLESHWDRTNPINLFGALHRARPEDRARLQTRILANKSNVEDLSTALAHLEVAISESPMEPFSHLRYGRLASLIGRDGQDHIEHARRLAPGNPRIQFQCGLLEFSTGRIDNMLADWQRSLRISVANLRTITVLSLNAVDIDRFVAEVLPEDPRILLQIAREYRNDSSYGTPLTARVLQQVRFQVNEFELPVAEHQHLLAQVEELTGNQIEAATHLQKAIEVDPHRIAWRYEYALLLEQLGRFPEALDHIRWCVRQAPRNKHYRSLLNRLYNVESTNETDS